jgi:hypothetical protein
MTLLSFVGTLSISGAIRLMVFEIDFPHQVIGISYKQTTNIYVQYIRIAKKMIYNLKATYILYLVTMDC